MLRLVNVTPITVCVERTILLINQNKTGVPPPPLPKQLIHEYMLRSGWAGGSKTVEHIEEEYTQICTEEEYKQTCTEEEYTQRFTQRRNKIQTCTEEEYTQTHTGGIQADLHRGGMHTDLHKGGGIQTCIEEEYNQTCTEAYRLTQRNTDSHRGGGIHLDSGGIQTDSHRGIQTDSHRGAGIQTDLHRGGMQMHESVSADRAKLPSIVLN